MQETELYEFIIGLPSLKIHIVEHDERKINIHCSLVQKEDTCPHCGEPSSVLHQYKNRKVRDLSISGKEVWLHLRLRQFYCITCNRRFIQKIDWLLSGKSYTKRQSKWMFEMCAKQPFTEAGALLNMCPKTLENNYYEQASSRLNLASRYSKVRKLGIDELSNGKGKKNYVCVLVDLETNTELDILPNRKKSTLLAHFKKLGDDFCKQIEVVCIDMWKTYLTVAQECFPNAEVVIDRFHVVKALNEVLDETRKKLRRTQPNEDSFKHLKWILFKRPEKCTQSQKDKIDKALNQSWELSEIYELRNTFNRIFDIYYDQKKLNQQLHNWMKHAKKMKNEHLDSFLKTLKNWKKQITAFAPNRITNAATEGLNNYIRYFKRISFGLSNFKNMRLRVLANSG